MIEISDTVRIETCPARKRAEATEELLDDNVTASHYKAPRKATKEEIKNPAVLTEDGMVVSLDSAGRPIRLGEEMEYIDWKAPEDEHVHIVYQLKTVTEKDAKGEDVKVERFMPVGSPYKDLDAAEKAARKL